MIVVEDLCKDFLLLGHSGAVASCCSPSTIPKFFALNGMSFRVEPGGILGLIGPNGAGKSTLLRILAGISAPTSGRVAVTGRITSVLEMATGFEPRLTGRENIRRHFRLRNFLDREIDNFEDEIVKFSELGDFVDRGVATYSSGMGARLAFSMATVGVADVVIIDELLSTGDEYFQSKCLRKIREICKRETTVIIASHDLGLIERFCDRAIWLESGKVQMIDDAYKVCLAYRGPDQSAYDKKLPKEYGVIKNLDMSAVGGKIILAIEIFRKKETTDLHLQLGMYDLSFGVVIITSNTAQDGVSIPPGTGTVSLKLTFDEIGGGTNKLFGVALYRGNGRPQESILEDDWGWDNGKMVFFPKSDQSAYPGFLKKTLKWKKCSLKPPT